MREKSMAFTKRCRGLSRRDFLQTWALATSWVPGLGFFFNYDRPVSGESSSSWAKNSGLAFSGAANFSENYKFSPLHPHGGLPETRALLPEVKPKIALIFTHISPDKPTWPYLGYDYEGRKRELAQKISQALPGMEFVPITLKSAEEAGQWLEKNLNCDGFIVYIVGIWTGAVEKIIAAGKPTILIDDLYAGTGEFLIAYARAKREGKKVFGVASSRFQDVIEAVHSFEWLKKLASSRILDVTDSNGYWGDPKVIKEVFGIEVQKINSPVINDVYQRMNRAEAEKWANHWIRQAERVVEPTTEEIKKSGAMYLALLELLSQYRAQAITIDCLSLFYGGKLPAYPCLGFFQLNNDGLVGACEGDLPSTCLMLLSTYMAGRPGYISDPVIDTARNQIIYAHCVAPNKVFGPRGRTNPYRLRSHAEDRKGAAVQSLLPAGEILTSVEFNCERREFVLHQAVSVGNVEEDKACRTKLAAQVKGDINKLMGEWDRFGWHRVTIYGDYKKPIEMTASLLGLKIIYEA